MIETTSGCYILFYIMCTLPYVATPYFLKTMLLSKGCCMFLWLIPMNTTLKISPHGRVGSYIRMHTHIILTYKWVYYWTSACTCVRVILWRHRHWNLASLILSPHQTGPWNIMLPWLHIEEIQYILQARGIIYHIVMVLHNQDTAHFE